MQWILGSFFLFYFPFWLQLVSLGEGKWKIEIFKVKSILAINVARWEWSSRSKGLVLRLLTSVICISGGYMYTYVGGYFGLFFQDQRLYFWLFLVTLPVRLGIRAVRRILPPPCFDFQYYCSCISYTYLWNFSRKVSLYPLLQHKNLIGLLSKTKFFKDVSFGECTNFDATVCQLSCSFLENKW